MIKGYNIEFEIGQIVYLKTDVEQSARMVTAICLKCNGYITYSLALGSYESWHYPIEISTERDIIKATSN